MQSEQFIDYLRRRCVEQQVKVEHGPFSREQGANDAYADIARYIGVYYENHQPVNNQKENDDVARIA